MSTSSKALEQALFQWREQTADERFGENYKEFGGGILMHDEVIKRVVELAQADKLKTTKHLQEQTNWAWTPEYGECVLKLVHEHFQPISRTSASIPSPSATRSAEARGNTMNPQAVPGPALPRSRAAPTCSLCGETGHKSTSLTLMIALTHIFSLS